MFFTRYIFLEFSKVIRQYPTLNLLIFYIIQIILNNKKSKFINIYQNFMQNRYQFDG